ncbi:MAG: DUF445 domain-containing protein [Ectobacillus sp.]
MSKYSKHLASSSLAVMGAGFAATLPFQGSALGAVLQGGFEAGLVGGLADWFAVTALFRHPLGIPIPHTALLPKNRQRLTKGLIRMLENNWLTKESITEKLNQIHITPRLLTALEERLASDSVKKGITAAAKQAILQLKPEQIVIFAEKEIKAYISAADVSPLLKSAVHQVLEYKYEEKALDYLLLQAKEWSEKDSSRNQLGSVAMKAIGNIELDGFMQFALKSFINLVDEEKLGGILQDFMIRGINSLADPSNGNRQALLGKIRAELEKGAENETLLKALENWKEALLSRWEASKQITEILQHIQQKALSFIKDESFYDIHALPFLKQLLHKVKSDPERIAQIESGLKNEIIQFIERNHSKIGKLVQENLDKLDDQTLISMMENNVGKDLQWIRVNGAVCGFIIGLFLEGIKMFI